LLAALSIMPSNVLRRTITSQVMAFAHSSDVHRCGEIDGRRNVQVKVLGSTSSNHDEPRRINIAREMSLK
jgi:hypothetical protein